VQMNTKRLEKLQNESRGFDEKRKGGEGGGICNVSQGKVQEGDMEFEGVLCGWRVHKDYTSKGGSIRSISQASERKEDKNKH
jgi:hypothetical protein